MRPHAAVKKEHEQDAKEGEEGHKPQPQLEIPLQFLPECVLLSSVYALIQKQDGSLDGFLALGRAGWGIFLGKGRGRRRK